MKRVVVDTTTSCFATKQLPDNLKPLRYHVYIAGQDYLDGETITETELTRMMVNNPSLLPETSPPDEEEIGDFLYQLMLDGYKEVYIITISDKLSEAYNTIKSMKGMFASHMQIHLFNSKSVAFVQGIMALTAAKMLEKDKSVFEVERKLKSIHEESEMYFVVNDLSSLIRTKRISVPAGFVANMLKIKPLLEVSKDGTIEVVERIRKISVALDTLCDTVIERAQQKGAKICIMSSMEDRLRARVIRNLSEKGYHDVVIAPFPASVVAHLGLGSVGLAIYKD